MATQFRTKEELLRSQWAEKYMSVSEGKLYTPENSPFPIHEYFKLGLLGKNIRMLEVNAGHALVEHMVADTLTAMTITIGQDESANEALEQEALEWFEQIDMEEKAEEACRYLYGVGHAEHQVHRTVDGDQNEFTVSVVDPSTWYPVLPPFVHLPVIAGNIVCVFPEMKGTSKVWFALVEEKTIGRVEFKLYQIERPDSLEGKQVPLATVPSLEKLEGAATGLEWLDVNQVNRAKATRNIFGQSVLQPIWGLLQETSEMQTQIRQERIKHFRSKMHAPASSLIKTEPSKDTMPVTSKQRQAETQQAVYDMNQEVFPIKDGQTPPGYITWDMQMIEKGSNEIDKILSRAAGIVGAPKSVFNIEEASGNVKVDTEKRKDRRYVRKIIQGQKRMAQLIAKDLKTWLVWSNRKDEKVKVTFANPFDMSQEEVIANMREMNPDAIMVSQQEALKRVWPDMKPEEREAMIQQIRDEEEARMPNTMAGLATRPPVTL